MNITSYQAAFGAVDKTGSEMRKAVEEWFDLYYRNRVTDGEDPCQRIACTVVSKLVRAVFAEYQASSDDPATGQLLSALNGHRQTAMQLALVGGECYLKPWVQGGKVGFTPVARNRALIFARDALGEPTDMGMVEQSTLGNAYYTLLERRTLGADGLTVEYKLFRSYRAETLGDPVSLTSHPAYRELSQRYTYPASLGMGLVRMKNPMLNCVDGSGEGVSVYAPATALIHAIDRNEYLLTGEFERGQSRVFASKDLLDQNDALSQNLFVGLDEDPERVGLTVFSPQLRENAFLARKQEYLRNVESVIGLKRGLLSDANLADRTATEIASSQGEHSLTVLDFQRMWQEAVSALLTICVQLCKLYGMAVPTGKVSMDWGNGELNDQQTLWADYKDMVARGLIAPEVALGWRFGMEAKTEADREAIRKRFMPNEQEFRSCPA